MVVLTIAVTSAKDDLLVLLCALDVEPIWRVVQDVDDVYSRTRVQTLIGVRELLSRFLISEVDLQVGQARFTPEVLAIRHVCVGMDHRVGVHIFHSLSHELIFLDAQ